MRLVVPAVVGLAVAACSGSSPTPTGVKPPTPSPSTFDTLLTGGSIPSGGGTLTVHKSGDPLDGLTLTLSPGAFSGALSVTIGSSTNKNLPTANGIVPISPVVHIASNNGGYANAVITLKIPATVPANTFPIVAMYDSATKAMEPMTTIAFDGSTVTAMTSHLSNANLFQLSGAATAGVRHSMSGDATPGGQPVVTLSAYAVPADLINQDWDTGFQPGTNDWDFPAIATEPTQNSATDFGAATTELWYFNTRVSTKALNKRFTMVANSALSDRIGYRWSSVILRNEYNRFADFVNSSIPVLQRHLQDSLQLTSIRAMWALATATGNRPLPSLMVLQDSGAENLGEQFVAYKAVGPRIYIADPLRPGVADRSVQLGPGGIMIPYQSQGGLPLINPMTLALGLAVPLSDLASTYQDATSGTIGNDLFPSAGLFSWIGQLYDTLYVVDTLRFWVQCGGCQYGFATTLSPTPSGNVGESSRILTLVNGLAVDSSNGSFGPGGKRAVANNGITPGVQTTYGMAILSANHANQGASEVPFRWVDWHQFTLTSLKTTISPAAPQVAPKSPLSLSLSVSPQLLPANVAYQWDFGDKSAVVTNQNDSTVQHTYSDTGTYNVTAKIIDNRNQQVIALGTTPVTVGTKPEVWLIQSLTYLYTLKNGVKSVNDSTTNHGIVLFLDSSSVHTLVALDGPPLPSATNYPAGVGFYLAQPPDSVQHWPNVQGVPLALANPYSPLDVVAYADSGNKTQGTIVGKAQSSTLPGSGPGTPYGYSIQLTKNGNTLSGYIQVQGYGQNGGKNITEVTVDSVVAQRVQ